MLFFRKILGKLHRVSLRGKILVALVVIMTLFLYSVSFSTKYYIVEKHGQEHVTSVMRGAHNYLYGYLQNMTYLFQAVIMDFEKHETSDSELKLIEENIQRWPGQNEPDIMFITDKDGRVIYSKNVSARQRKYDLVILKKAMEQGEVSGIEVLDADFLREEGLVDAARVNIVETPNATKTAYDKENDALAMMVAEPINRKGTIVGFAVIGKLLNHNNYLVDNIKDSFNVRSTIFLDKVRIATNVTNDKGERAIGTLMSDQVYQKIIVSKQKFTGRAFVVNGWYLTAYEPIVDISGKTVGALYVGESEEPLMDMQRSINNQIRLTLAIAVLVFSIAILWIYSSIVKPIQQISSGVLHIARGDFATRVTVANPNRCWEIMNCGHQGCIAYQNSVIRCWLLPEAACREEGERLGSPETCLQCDVYNIYSGNELERLVDAVNYMALCIDDKTHAMKALNKQLEVKNQELSDNRDELESQKDSLLQLNSELEASMKALDDSQNIIYALAVAVEAKDPYTRGHSERVAEYSMRLAKTLGLDAQQLELLKGAALLHDIGKIGISGSILRKPGTLNALEFQQVRKHPAIGERICLSLKFAQEMLPIIRHHHEHFNGQGYPDGLKGEHIPLLARIIAVADAFDAMTSDRPYRSGMPKEEATRRLLEGAGSQWDPEIVPVFIAMMKTDMPKPEQEIHEQTQFID